MEYVSSEAAVCSTLSNPAFFSALIGSLPDALVEASYVSVLELPADDWGWGGRTQAARLPR